jgi:hypothetical protein
MTVRVLYPEAPGPFPLVVYSSGMFCLPQMYDLITTHWVSYGYVVITPNHLDSPNNTEKFRLDQSDVVLPSRVREVSFVLDAIEEIGRKAGAEGRIDTGRIAIGGHSFGAVISMIKTGLYLKEEFKGPWGEPYDDRFQAAVLMSGVGHGMREMADNAFDGLRKPLIATGGTKDVGRVNLGNLTPEQWRMQPFLLAPPGDRYSVITEGSNHYMGGLICNPKLGGNEPDMAAVTVVRAMTTVFLDAYVKKDPAAMKYLRTVDLARLTENRARLRSR